MAHPIMIQQLVCPQYLPPSPHRQARHACLVTSSASAIFDSLISFAQILVCVDPSSGVDREATAVTLDAEQRLDGRCHATHFMSRPHQNPRWRLVICAIATRQAPQALDENAGASDTCGVIIQEFHNNPAESPSTTVEQYAHSRRSMLLRAPCPYTQRWLEYELPARAVALQITHSRYLRACACQTGAMRCFRHCL